MRVGVLGPEGTFSQMAAEQYARRRHLNFQFFYFPDLARVMKALVQDQVELAIVPVENSQEGSLSTTLDFLLWQDGVQIQDEEVLAVRHWLWGKPGTRLDQISAVLSHHQALAQCQGWLNRRLPQAIKVLTTSTSEACAKVAKSEESLAAIAAPVAGAAYGLEALAEDLQDNKNNATRFLVLGKGSQSLRPQPGEKWKTSIAFGTPHEPGALYRALEPLARQGLNLCKIESRPAKRKLGEYIFLVDIEGCSLEPGPVSQGLIELMGRAAWVKMLGCYPAAPGGGEDE
ncbi:MAG: prephenate dehydratase [Bacillota bacterium]|uniref:Prephenate dehydratase n=2 Tax=Carboxydocella TaxID=178898 RepID=A0A1T4PVD4_9FIRM|nr:MULTISPECIES: prephenate dehydratase [Carboxydocella]AVX20445.1 prephenate dehydratase [Carboxydocella thermautotrophica]AVX30866.1 prephenate dehydratase [Carboxydocella thermautotrophica]SJZ95326.1 prephenate dehydratase [Carboxydocella sporoproducens DSM 16521]GAW29738.1 prephenate dehydratase [Carboxydocella sp. ULO1]GAW32424.1 prephenate dehydratase [Carboxydocella sp. JDF658]